MSGVVSTRMRSIKSFEPVRGLTVAVIEPQEAPDTVSLVILDTIDGWSTVSETDRTDPGATARAISLGEIIYDALTAAEMTWFENEASV